MNLFLQGRSGMGKSALLREVLAPYSRMMAGFSAQRLIEDGERIGFRTAPFDDGYPPLETAYTGGLDGVFIIRGLRNVSALEEAILRAEQESRKPGRKLVLLDEIGGIELLSPIVMDALKKLLSGKTPCAGVFKSDENFERMAANLRLSEGCRAPRKELEALIEKTGRLITVTEQNREEIRDELVVRLVPLLCKQHAVN